MWSMFLNSAQLFMKGKLFRDPMQVLRQSAIGVALGALILVILAKAGVPLWAAAAAAALATGLAQPYLFKNLKYN